MRALRIERPGDIRLVEVEKPEPQADEVLIAVRSAGICGSDLELLRATRPEPYARYPIIPGHEWAGEVVESGEGANVRPGDAVVAEGFRNCGECARCREGHTNLCIAEYAETGFTHSGGFAEFVVVPSRLVHRLDALTNFAAAALLEPAACVVEGLIAADPAPGLEAAIVGAGTLGLLAVALLEVMAHPARLVLVGTQDSRLVLGRDLGATHAIDLGGRDSAIALEPRYDLVIEATNRPGGANTAFELARRGGTVVLLGINGSSEPSVVSDLVTLRQLRVHGVFGASRGAWSRAVEVFARCRPPFERLVTHRFQLEQFTQAFGVLEDRSSGAVKVQFQL